MEKVLLKLLFVQIQSDQQKKIDIELVKECGILPLELSEKLTNEIKKLSKNKMCEFLKVVQHLEIKDNSSLEILVKICKLLKGQDSLAKAAEIQDGYLREILYNRPNFDTAAKIRCILNACKNSEGTHIIKNGNLFFNTEKDGNISPLANEGNGESRVLGLFTGDMRFISQYELSVKDFNNKDLSGLLVCSENQNYYSYDENLFGKNVIIKRNRAVNEALFEKIEIINNNSKSVKVQFEIASDVKDIFEVRGKICLTNSKTKIECNCVNEIMMNSEMESGNTYGVLVNIKDSFSVIKPVFADEIQNKITYEFIVPAQSSKKLAVKIQPLFNYQYFADSEIVTETPACYEEAVGLVENIKKSSFAKLIIDCDVPNAQKTIDNCLKDLNMLVSYVNIDDKAYSYIDAGLPRYSALFGRDSIITALEVFKLNPNIAKDTLDILAHFQGQTFEERHKVEIAEIQNSNWSDAIKNASLKGIQSLYAQREESYGKILHELRVGEMAISGVIPHRPYYGTVDATPLWIILFCEYFKWSEDLEFTKKLLPNAEAALEWIKKNTFNNYLRFTASMNSKVKIQNQGWKDAGDSIKHVVNPKGYLSDPEYPIALAEVQGYAYKAFILMSELYAKLGRDEKSRNLKLKASCLKSRFNEQFWIEEEEFFTMALDVKNNAVKNITSNIGHCLAMGIINEDKISVIEEKLMSDEMFTGWGIRTLSSKCEAYDPISYHNGSVWVHDTAIAASGLSPELMSIVTKGLFEAANMFENNRLPELFGGFQRKPEDCFIQGYPEACAPQAWASGALIHLMLKMLSLKIENDEIFLDNPHFPKWIKNISIKGINIKNKSVNVDNFLQSPVQNVS